MDPEILFSQPFWEIRLDSTKKDIVPCTEAPAVLWDRSERERQERPRAASGAPRPTAGPRVVEVPDRSRASLRAVLGV